jgi:hypothetical protein
LNTLETILSGEGAAAPWPDANLSSPADDAAGDPAFAAGPPPAPEPSTGGGDGHHAAAPPHGYVPNAAIREAREENRALKEQLAALQGQFAAMQGFMGNASQAAPGEAPQPPQWFDNPEEATRHALRPEFQRVHHAVMHNARLVAGAVHGGEQVEAAQAAFDDALHGGQLDELDYQRVMSSPNPFAAAVEWHQRHTILAEIGADPAAYRARLEADTRAKILREIQETGQLPALPYGGAPQPQPQGAPAPVFPSDLAGARSTGGRTGPAYGGPPALTDIFKR